MSLMNKPRSDAGWDSRALVYKVARGDELLQDKVFSHETIRRGLDKLANEHGAGQLAYTPEMTEKFETILQRRYASDLGDEIYQMPNYAPYEDPDLAAFYGCNTSDYDNIPARKETFDETTERLIAASARELAEEIPGLQQVMNMFAKEEWARYGIANEVPYAHVDPDQTLFRNYDNNPWSAMDLPAATADRQNVLDMYSVQPEWTFPVQHDGWLIDRKNGYYDQLDPGNKPAYGFY